MSSHIIELARRAGAVAARAWPWTKRRLRERSTWSGAVMLVGALGYHELAARLGAVADALTLLGVLSGAGLVAATTSQHPAQPQP